MGSLLARGTGLAAAALGGVAAAQLLRSRPAQLAQMSGSTIAAPTAAGWVTDFLNAAYFARGPGQRDVDDLRLAFCVLTSRWERLGGRRLGALDVAAFHRAFGRARLADSPASPRGTLTRQELLIGGARLLGEWFPGAYADPQRRAYGIAFASPAHRKAYAPELRLRNAAIGPLTPPEVGPHERTWHTYPPVPANDADGVVAALRAVERWPDYASEIGRFTPLRDRGLDSQTFEIEVCGRAAERAPLYLRAYVTVTRLCTREDRDDLDRYVDELNVALRTHAPDEPQPVPDGAVPVAAVDLTSHAGHFMGSACNRLLVYELEGKAYLRAVGTWDPMPWHLDRIYTRAGRYAQHAFWGMESPSESMLHQIALDTGGVA